VAKIEIVIWRFALHKIIIVAASLKT